MIFTTVGRIVAVVVFVLALIWCATAFAVATGVLVEPEPGGYLGSKTPGEAMDQSFYVMFLMITLGVITDISRTVAKANRSRTTPPKSKGRGEPELLLRPTLDE